MRALQSFAAAFVALLSMSESIAMAAEPPPPPVTPAVTPPVTTAPAPPSKPAAALPAAPAKPRVLVLDVVSDELSASERATLTNIVAAHLGDDTRLDVLSGDDIKQLVALQGQAQEVGVGGNCINDACLAELAGALGAGMVVSTRAGKLGDTIVVTLAIFDATKAKSVARKLVNVTSLGELPAKLGPALDELVVPLVNANPATSKPPAVTMPPTTMEKPTTPATHATEATTAPATQLASTRIDQLYDSQAAQICVTKEDASAWYFCNRVGALTENEFVRRYSELTDSNDLAAHDHNRASDAGFIVGFGLVLGAVGAGGIAFGSCAIVDACGELSQTLRSDPGPAAASGALGALALIGGTALVATGVVVTSDGIPQEHTMNEREGRAAITRYNAALMKKLRRDLGD